MCGIRIAGENCFLITPRPGGNFTYAKAKYHSIYGEAVSGWEKTAAGYRFHISLPCNTSATVRLPDGSEHRVSAGEYTFDLDV